MSHAAKTGTALAVVAVLIVIGLVWYAKAPSSEQALSAPSENAIATSQGPSPTMSDPSDTSDSGLRRDMTAVDSQIQSMSSDSTSVDQSISASQQ